MRGMYYGVMVWLTRVGGVGGVGFEGPHRAWGKASDDTMDVWPQ